MVLPAHRRGDCLQVYFTQTFYGAVVPNLDSPTALLSIFPDAETHNRRQRTPYLGRTYLEEDEETGSCENFIRNHEM